MSPLLRIVGMVVVSALAVGCGRGVNSEAQARRAYLGLDKSIGKSLALGFAGFNAASSANIPNQTASGDELGTLTISGQVDQGSSANKGMRLRVGMVGYSDGDVQFEDEVPFSIIYDTPTDPEQQPKLDLQLRDIPNGTFTGTLVGAFEMSGDMTGPVALNLSMSGEIEDAGGGEVRRKAGTTSITGTATSGNAALGATAEYKVNVSL